MNSLWFFNHSSLGNSSTSTNLSYPIIRQPIIVLASKSKNRLKLLQKIGINPIVEHSNFAENLSNNLEPWFYAEETARHKAEDVADRFRELDTTFDVIIGADTIIYLDGIIFGKPKNSDDAFWMLKELNNRKHSVYTGVTLINSKFEMEKFHVKTDVKFGNIPEFVLKAYVNTGEALGCAGSYGIQGKASAFVESIEGCYYNIIGLPIYELVRRFPKFLKK